MKFISISPSPSRKIYLNILYKSSVRQFILLLFLLIFSINVFFLPIIIKALLNSQTAQKSYETATLNIIQTFTVTPTSTVYLSSITPTQIPPSLTPTINVQTLITPISTANSETPEQFIRTYFTNINNRNYEKSWSMLSKRFQSRHTYDEYTTWWNTVKKVEIIFIEVRSETNSEVFIYVEARYHYKSGVITTGHTTYKLIKNDSGESWLFDRN